jgi:hypothetical protein
MIIKKATYGIGEDEDIDITSYLIENDYRISTYSNLVYTFTDPYTHKQKYVQVEYQISEENGILDFNEINNSLEKTTRWCIGFDSIDFHISIPNFYEYIVKESSCEIDKIIVLNEENEEYILESDKWAEIFIKEDGYYYVNTQWKPEIDPFVNKKKRIRIYYHRSVTYEITVYELGGFLLKNLDLHIEIPLYKTCMIFHFYPDYHHTMTDIHIQYINKFKKMFNRIYISMAHQHRHLIEQNEQILMDRLGNPPNVIILRTFNNRHRGEATSFLSLLNTVCNKSEMEFIFYAHSKGLRHQHLKSIQVWTELMYVTCLANLDQMIQNDANFGGSFLRPGFSVDNNYTRWHYSGSFYWMNNRMLQRRHFMFRRGGHEYYISEKFPGTCCPTKEKCLAFLDFPHSNNDNLYEDSCIDTFQMLTNALNIPTKSS